LTTHTSPHDVIRGGQIESCQLTRAGSNYTFLVKIELEGQETLAIYKPRDGEAPLWDFPTGTLYKREYAAYLLSDALGWDIVPFTIIRDGPYGIGSVQEYIDHDPSENYYTLTSEHAAQLQVVCCFDLVANSTDRKANHLLRDDSDKLWSIDHGLTFHSDIKIRTVIWDFGGQPIPEPLLDALTDLGTQLQSPQEQLSSSLKELVDVLDPAELEAFKGRLAWVLAERSFPGLPGRRRRR
jgi:uncharacterized repeat protein (TIGR03843 family)